MNLGRTISKDKLERSVHVDQYVLSAQYQPTDEAKVQSVGGVWIAFLSLRSVFVFFCQWISHRIYISVQVLFSAKFLLKLGPIILFIYLKIILLQCLQFLRISNIQIDPQYAQLYHLFGIDTFKVSREIVTPFTIHRPFVYFFFLENFNSHNSPEL